MANLLLYSKKRATLYLLFCNILIGFVSCNKSKKVTGVILNYDTTHLPRNYALVQAINTSTNDVDITVIQTSINQKSVYRFPVFKSVEPKDTVTITYADTSYYSYIPHATSSGTGLLSNALVGIITFITIILPVLLTGFVTYIVTRRNERAKNKETKNETRNLESLLLFVEIVALKNHVRKNKIVLEKIDLAEGIPTALHIKKMRIDEDALSLSIDTARVFEDRKLIDNLLLFRLQLRNVNMEIDHIIEHIEKEKPSRILLQDYIKLMIEKTDHVTRKATIIIGLLQKKIEETDLTNRKPPTIIYEKHRSFCEKDVI